MAVKVQHVCDNNLAHDGVEVEGAPVPLSVSNTEGLLDLCQECRLALVEPLIELLVEFGRTEDGKAVRPGRRPSASSTTIPDSSNLLPKGVPIEELQKRADEGYCPLDPSCKQLKSRQAVASHVRSYHGVVGGLEALGMGKRGLNQPAKKATCMECDPPRTFDTVQGRAAHHTRVHLKKGGRKARAA